MSLLLAVLLRVAVLGAMVTAYMQLIVPLLGEPGDPNIGAGLIAFAMVIVVSFGWSLVDGRGDGFSPTTVRWAIVAVIFSLGWVVLLVVAESDDALTTSEAVGAFVGLVPFTVGLVLAPGLVGAAIGRSLRGGLED